MEDLLQYVVDEALVLIPALLVVGRAIKATPVASWIIPWALMPLGVTGAVGLMGASAEAVVQGVLVAGAAVYLHQLKRQTERSD